MLALTALQSLRARAAYWEKRISLEKGQPKRNQLERFAWAELTRLAIQHGIAAYQPCNVQLFEAAMQGAFTVASRQTKRGASRAPAAGARR